MAKSYSKEEIEKYKDFLGEYLQLKGIDIKKNFRCFSKEHEDKHPSMNYYAPAKICKCFACAEKYNIFKLVGEEYGLEKFIDQVKKVEQLYKNRDLIESIHKTVYSLKTPIDNIEITKKEEKIENTEHKYKKSMSNYFYECIENLKDCDYLTKRGISKKIQEKYHIGYDPNFKNGEWKAIIIPTYINSFTARNTDYTSNDRLRKIGKAQIFNFWELKKMENKRKNYYIVEGEIDALSLCEVGRNAIALGSISNIDLLIEKFKELKPQNQFFIMLDNDKQGIKAQIELCSKLKEIRVNFIETVSLKNYKDPNEFLVSNREEFIKELEKIEKTKNIWSNKINKSFVIGD